MKQVTAAALVLLMLEFILPVLLIRGQPAQEPEDAVQPQTVLPLHRATPPAVAEGDAQHTLTLLEEDGSVSTLTMEEYLWSVVAAEMPASFQPEALKAQAVAARTYAATRQANRTDKHPQADLCTDSSCCQAYITRQQALDNWGERGVEYEAKIAQAVAETDGLGVVYNGAPIQAVFFSSAPGHTADAQEVWGNQIPYLVGVDSPEGEEVPNYRAQLTLTAQEFKDLVLSQYPDMDLSGEIGSWIGEPTCNDAGLVLQVNVGGVELTGGQLRKLLGLRSACFTVSVSGEELTFHTVGYGHGVGMSQYGANAMAREGSGFREILTWYYTGAEVERLW